MFQSDRLELAWNQIEFARSYVRALLADISDDEWFVSGDSYPTHLAWQVGHLAMAEYGLTLFRQRGRADVDTQLMSSKFRKLFSKGSTPQSDRSLYPAPDEILAVLDRVHQQAGEELPSFSDEHLNEPVDMPYTAFPTKLGSVLFCSHHEMLHAGQIGLLRRMLGKDPLR